MDFISEVEVRVLGSLIEKDITTPDYYPLSLNALVNACNQKNNRDPVMALDEESVRAAIDSLQAQRLQARQAAPIAGSRNMSTVFRRYSTLTAARLHFSVCCGCAVPRLPANFADAQSACIVSKRSMM